MLLEDSVPPALFALGSRGQIYSDWKTAARSEVGTAAVAGAAAHRHGQLWTAGMETDVSAADIFSLSIKKIFNAAKGAAGYEQHKAARPRPSLTARRHTFAHGDKRLPFSTLSVGGGRGTLQRPRVPAAAAAGRYGPARRSRLF